MLSKTFKIINTHTLASGTASAQRDFTATSDVSGIGGINFFIDYSSYTTFKLKIEHNGIVTDYGGVSGTKWFLFTDIPFYKGDKITVYSDTTTYNTQSYFISAEHYKEFINTKAIKVFELKEISEKVNCYLLGRLPDGTRWDGN